MTSLFLFAIFISFLLLLFVIYLSHKYKLFIDRSDYDKPQNFHIHSTPRAGGFGILFGMLLLLLTPLGIKFIPSIVLAFLSGIFEDLHNSLSPKFRLFLQLIAALCAVWLTDSVVTYLGLGISMPYWMGILFSVFAIVGMMNAVNIIDGFNGLASGTILLILFSFGTISYQQDNFELLSIILITLGATIGFFILNFPKGKIFLGDGGAYLLGFIVAIIGIFLASNYESVSPWYILAIFIYPVWEVIFSIGRKLFIGISPMEPDSYHFHMLIYRQITKNNALTSLFILCMISPFITISTLFFNHSISNIIIAGFFILCYLLVYFYLYKKEKNNI
jgi:UDP-N-acetylmuramyl pentapeptide phosphotransferase/UDP-N-acetylglucosamine-1-phosphate transferase